MTVCDDRRVETTANADVSVGNQVPIAVHGRLSRGVSELGSWNDPCHTTRCGALGWCPGSSGTGVVGMEVVG